MQKTIFKPKYPGKTYFGLPVIILLEFYMLWQILSGKDNSPETIFMATFFGLLLAIMPYAFVRQIVFTANAFSIE
ncbi:MAG TPA: hypothetical protein VFQ13_03040, partial [Anaerolineales bacterium]|nr:hypothetical protein [Anaerolineales bacterium]